MNSARAAERYIDRGVSVVPLRPRGKETVLESWPELRLAIADLPKYFHADSNIGILNGEPSRGLVDVDLDCSEAIAIALVMMPETLTSGRKGSPATHHWYRCDPVPRTRKYALSVPGGGSETIIELRSTGTQTLVPPSVYPDGERCTWGAGKVHEIPGPELERLVLEVAVGAVVLRHWPQRGRHAMALAVAGFLGRL